MVIFLFRVIFFGSTLNQIDFIAQFRRKMMHLQKLILKAHL